MNPAKFSFPAVKGIQANMEYYVTMVPLDCIPKLFTFSDENMPPEVRSQRTLNKSRIPEMCNYILQNPTSYVFSALTASIDGEVCFDPASPDNSTVGTLSIAMSAKLLINDGQHRKAAIEAALKKTKETDSYLFESEEPIDNPFVGATHGSGGTDNNMASIRAAMGLPTESK